MSNFCERLDYLQKTNNIMKKDIAKNIGVSVMAYYRYETGDRIPNADVLIALANLFSVSLDYLVGRSDDPTLH